MKNNAGGFGLDGYENVRRSVEASLVEFFKAASDLISASTADLAPVSVRRHKRDLYESLKLARFLSLRKRQLFSEKAQAQESSSFGGDVTLAAINSLLKRLRNEIALADDGSTRLRKRHRRRPPASPCRFRRKRCRGYKGSDRPKRGRGYGVRVGRRLGWSLRPPASAWRRRVM